MSNLFPDRERNSMLYWYPKIKDKIPTPKTVMIEVDFEYIVEYMDNKNNLERYREKILVEARKIGFPLFMRVDQTSDKHNWKDTCYVPNEKVLFKHLARIIEFSLMVDILGLQVKAVVLREFLQLKSVFKAFNGMPIAREFRCLATDGKIDCIHPYWFQEAIEFQWDRTELEKAKKGLTIDQQIELMDKVPEPPYWREKLGAIRILYDDEKNVITKMVEKTSHLVEGSWSIDVCQTVENKWLITDMALAEQSYHYPHEGKPKDI